MELESIAPEASRSHNSEGAAAADAPTPFIEFTTDTLTPKQRAEWLQTGDLPDSAKRERKEIAHDGTPSLLELTSQMTSAERKKWQETGHFPDRLMPREKPTAQESDDDAPRRDDTVWTKPLEGEDMQKHQKRVEKNVGKALEHIQKHKQSEEITRGLTGLFSGRHQALEGDFMQALAEVGNPGAVLEHLGLNPIDRAELLKAPNWQTLRQYIHGIADQLQERSRKGAERRLMTKAPEIGREIGGKNTPPPDEVEHALKANDTRAFIDAENRRELRKRKHLD